MAAFERVSTVSPHRVRVDRSGQIDPEDSLTDIRTDRPSTVDLRSTRLPSHLSITNLAEFDPRDHRHPKAPIKEWMAYFNLVRAGMGAGMLGFPVAMSQAGIVLGPIMALAIAFLLIHTQSNLMMDWDSNLPAILTLLPAYLLLEYFMKNLRIISYISLISNLFNAIGQGLVFYLIFLNPQKNDIKQTTTEPLPLAFAFGLCVFNLSGLGVIIALDRNLSKPIIMTKRYGVIEVGVLLPTAVAIVFGCLGYWSFGTMEENVLRSLPYDEMTSMVCMGFYLVALMLTYPIHCYPAIWIITDILKNMDTDGYDAKTLKVLESIARPTFVITSFFICYLVPFQACFVAFVGSLCTSLMSLVFPAMMELGMMYPGPYGRFYIYLIKDLLILCIGLISFVFGTFLCGNLLYIRFLMLRSPHSEV